MLITQQKIRINVTQIFKKQNHQILWDKFVNFLRILWHWKREKRKRRVSKVVGIISKYWNERFENLAPTTWYNFLLFIFQSGYFMFMVLCKTFSTQPKLNANQGIKFYNTPSLTVLLVKYNYGQTFMFSGGEVWWNSPQFKSRFFCGNALRREPKVCPKNTKAPLGEENFGIRGETFIKIEISSNI